MGQRLSSKERRKEILNKSLEIIYEKGFYSLTIRNIAEEIDISEAAVYRHFKNKKEIIAKLADKFFCHDEKINDIKESKHSIEKLKDIINIQFKIFANNPLMTVIIFQEEIFREYPEVWNKFNLHRQKREEVIKKIINEGKENGEIKEELNTENFAVLFMGAVRMTVIKWRGSDFDFSIIKKGKEISNELLDVLK